MRFPNQYTHLLFKQHLNFFGIKVAFKSESCQQGSVFRVVAHVALIQLLQ